MKRLSHQSRNGYCRSLRLECLETRRLLSADLSAGAAHAAHLVHHELSNAVEVGKADPGRSPALRPARSTSSRPWSTTPP